MRRPPPRPETPNQRWARQTHEAARSALQRLRDQGRTDEWAWLRPRLQRALEREDYAVAAWYAERGCQVCHFPKPRPPRPRRLRLRRQDTDLGPSAGELGRQHAEELLRRYAARS
jgi:hypothetical protein